MGMLGDRIGVQKAQLEDGERFILFFEKNEDRNQTGYMFSTSEPLDEAELTTELSKVGLPDSEIRRLIVQARANYK